MDRVDVLIVTALQDELDAVLRLGRVAFREARDASGQPYHVSEFPSAKGGSLRVAAAWIGGMGEAIAGMRATSLVRDLDPSCLAMCGICAGRREVVSLGDVIVADRVYSYDHGKLIAGEGGEGFFHDIETYNLDRAWHTDASTFARDKRWAEEIGKERPVSRAAQERWLLHALFAHESEGAVYPGESEERKARCPDWPTIVVALRQAGLVVFKDKRLWLSDAGRERVMEEQITYPDGLPEDPPLRVFVGPIATGKVVREDPKIFERLSRLVRKTAGVEMEAAAIGQVAAHLGRRSIIVKEVSAHADQEKDDSYRAFACRASAAWLLAFLERYLEPRAEASPPSPQPVPSVPGAVFFSPNSSGDPRMQALRRALDDAEARKDKLKAASAPTEAVDREILSIKREMREGGILRVGDSLGDRPYLLIELIGSGGFAHVWRARATKTNEEVAIKVLRSDLAADPGRRERFFRGARIMAELEHPGVVRVLEQRCEDGGYQYFVMEFVRGQNLRDAVLSGAVKGEGALPLVLSVGEALAVAHARKMVHRDVKPANILLDAEGKPRLTDFDLVAAMDTTGGTKTGAMGTFVYAAPECLHHPQSATPKADVFGLGMCAVFALHGKELPLEVVRDAAGFIDMLECPGAVKRVLKRAVEWDASLRFVDAGEFCVALREAMLEPAQAAKAILIRIRPEGAITYEQVQNAIAQAGGNQSVAARRLGISRSLLVRLISKYNRERSGS